MDVIYAIKKDPRGANPFVCIYRFCAEPSNGLQNNYSILGRRQATAKEQQLIGVCSKQYRIYYYNNVFDLVKDDAMIGIDTPSEVIEKLNLYEKQPGC